MAQQKKSKLPFGWIALVAVLLFLLYVLGLMLFPKRDQILPLTLSHTDTAELFVADKQAFLRVNDHLYAYKKHNALAWQATLPSSQCFVVANGKYAAAAEVGDTQITVYKNGAESAVFPAAGPIRSLFINKAGVICAIVDKQSYVSCLTVYTATGEEKFSYASDSGFFTAAQYSTKTNSVVTTLVNYSGAEIVSYVEKYTIKNGTVEKAFSHAFDNQLAVGLCLYRDDSLSVLTDSCLEYIDPDGTVNFRRGFGGRTMTHAGIEDPNHFYIAFTELNDSTKIEFFNRKNQDIGAYTLNDTIVAACSCGKQLAVGIGGEIHLISDKGKVSHILPEADFLKGMALFSDARHLLLLTDLSASVETVK